jgi:hypothetical protein
MRPIKSAVSGDSERAYRAEGPDRRSEPRGRARAAPRSPCRRRLARTSRQNPIGECEHDRSRERGQHRQNPPAASVRSRADDVAEGEEVDDDREPVQRSPGFDAARQSSHQDCGWAAVQQAVALWHRSSPMRMLCSSLRRLGLKRV